MLSEGLYADSPPAIPEKQPPLAASGLDDAAGPAGGDRGGAVGTAGTVLRREGLGCGYLGAQAGAEKLPGPRVIWVGTRS